MALVIPFPRRAETEAEEEIDLFTAVDVAIRDLREIAARLEGAWRDQAEDCRRMLERAFEAAREVG